MKVGAIILSVCMPVYCVVCQGSGSRDHLTCEDIYEQVIKSDISNGKWSFEKNNKWFCNWVLCGVSLYSGEGLPLHGCFESCCSKSYPLTLNTDSCHRLDIGNYPRHKTDLNCYYHINQKKNITINRVIEMLQKFILQKFTNIHTFCIEKKILIIMFSVNIVFSHHIKFLEFYNQKVTSDKIWAYILYQGWCKGQSMICGLPTPLHLNLYKVVFI